MSEQPQHHPLTALRALLGLSATEYLRQVDARHRELGFGAMATRREKVARWESGANAPEWTAQLAMADLHGVAADAVRRLGWPRFLLLAFAADQAVLGAPWTSAGAVTALTAAVQGSAADRRTFPIVTGPTLTEVARAWARAPADELSTFGVDRPRLPDRLLERLEARLVDLRRLQTLLSGAQVQLLARGDLEQLERFATSTGFDARSGARLLRAIAGTSVVYGWALMGVGRIAAAQSAYVTGLRAAACTADGTTAHHALAYLGMHAYTRGDPGDLLRLLSGSLAGWERPPVEGELCLSA